MKAILKNLRISPKKVNLVAGLVREKSVIDALTILSLTPKRSAKKLRDTLQSAVKNAEQNFKQDAKNLEIDQIVVTQGRTLKRFNPVSRGRAHPILKRSSHVQITLKVINNQ